LGWGKYLDYMIPIANNKQITYMPYMDEIVGFNGVNKKYGNYGMITFNDKVTNLAQFFYNNTELTRIDIPSECEIISESAFEGCANLEMVTLSNSLKLIEQYAFKDCTTLKSFIIPEDVNNLELEDGIFAGCKNIKCFDGKFATYKGKAIVCNNNLICVTPQDKNPIHKISEIGKNIKRLGKYCFYGCENMTSVHIPSTVLSIGNYAFKDCLKIKEVYFEGNPPILGINIFDGVQFEENFKIYVPKDLYQLYESVYVNESFSKYITYKE
jgi:hypothetical protein